MKIKRKVDKEIKAFTTSEMAILLFFLKRHLMYILLKYNGLIKYLQKKNYNKMKMVKPFCIFNLIVIKKA